MNKTTRAAVRDAHIIRRRVRGLIDAVAFYADPSTYHAVAFWFDSPCGGFDDDFDENHGNPFYDRPMPGRTAREALSI